MTTPMLTQSRTLRTLTALTFILGLACEGHSEPTDGCQSDAECKGNRVCQNGECVDPASMTSSSPTSIDGPITGDMSADTGTLTTDDGGWSEASGALTGGPVCALEDAPCEIDTDCCSSSAVCVLTGDTSYCRETCQDHGECVTGCCYEVEPNKPVCSPPTVCEPWCTPLKSECLYDSECCGDETLGNICVLIGSGDDQRYVCLENDNYGQCGWNERDSKYSCAATGGVPGKVDPSGDNLIDGCPLFTSEGEACDEWGPVPVGCCLLGGINVYCDLDAKIVVFYDCGLE